MSENKFTPGPWEISDHWDDDCKKCIDAPTHGALAEAVYRMEYEDWPSEELKANVSLIAAAPELFEALEELIDLFQDYINGDYEPDSFTFQPAEKAIAKAKGQSK